MKTIAEIEKKVKEYFINIDTINFLKNELDFLENKKKEIEEDMPKYGFDNGNPLKGVAYDSVKVQTSYNGSMQEKAVDSAYRYIEQQLNNVENKISGLKIKIRDIEIKNKKMDYIINQLKGDCKTILQELYGKKNTVRNISGNISLDASNVSRRKNDILNDILKYFNYYTD